MQVAAIEAPQAGIAAHGVNRCFAPEAPEHRIALFGESSEALPLPARVFAGNQAHVTGQRLRVGKPRRIAQEHVRRERRHRTDARMRHQPAGLRTCARLLTDALIECVDLRRHVLVERLPRRPPIAGIRREGSGGQRRLTTLRPETGAAAEAVRQRQALPRVLHSGA